jgi:hypothetical protein
MRIATRAWQLLIARSMSRLILSVLVIFRERGPVAMFPSPAGQAVPLHAGAAIGTVAGISIIGRNAVVLGLGPERVLVMCGGMARELGRQRRGARRRRPSLTVMRTEEDDLLFVVRLSLHKGPSSLRGTKKVLA